MKYRMVEKRVDENGEVEIPDRAICIKVVSRLGDVGAGSPFVFTVTFLEPVK